MPDQLPRFNRMRHRLATFFLWVGFACVLAALVLGIQRRANTPLVSLAISSMLLVWLARRGSGDAAA